MTSSAPGFSIMLFISAMETDFVFSLGACCADQKEFILPKLCKKTLTDVCTKL